MTDDLLGIKIDILAHARAVAPEECCGFIIARTDGKTGTVRCDNLADDKLNFFCTDPAVLRKIQNRHERVLGVYHSHPNGPPKMTMSDYADAEAQRIPFLMLSWPADEERQTGDLYDDRTIWEMYVPEGREFDYEDRPFVHGALDCFTLIRDWYRRELNIELPDFDRPDNWWRVQGLDLYRRNIRKTGFVRVRDEDIRRNDVMIFAIGDTAGDPNHAAIYLGEGMMLHHPPARQSCKQPFVVEHGYYAKHLWGVIRHKSQIDAETKLV